MGKRKQQFGGARAVGASRAAAFQAYAVDAGEFNYNPKVSVETSQKSFRDSWHRPIGGVSNQNGPFTIAIDPMVDQYVQLHRAMLEVKARIVLPDGSYCHPVEDICAPINLLGVNMWDSVEVELNGQPFPGSSSIHSNFKYTMETMLTYDADSMNTHLQTQMFHLDSPQKFQNMCIKQRDFRKYIIRAIRDGVYEGPTIPDELQMRPGFEMLDEMEEFMAICMETRLGDCRPTNARLKEEAQKRSRRNTLYAEWIDTNLKDVLDNLVGVEDWDRINLGFCERAAIVRGSELFDMYSPVPHDFFRINNNIGPNNRIVVRFNRAKDSFLINSLAGKAYRLQIVDMRLHLHTIERRERIARPMVERYHMTETQMMRQIVAVHSPGTTFRVHHGGIMPKNIVVAMVSTRAAEGAYDINPLHFRHFDISNMALIINGEKYPTTGLEFNFKTPNSLVSRSYYWMFENTGAWSQEKGNAVSWPAFQNGSFIVPFDLTPDKCNSLHNHMAEEGYIDLELKFDGQLSEPIYVYSMLCYPKMVINDRDSQTVTSLHLGDVGTA